MSERQNKRLAQKEATRMKRRMIEKVLSNSKTRNAAFNLNYLVDGWLELDSDPGTFSLLIEDFGCFGAQVEEIYDLEQKFDGPVFGFIFLFKWLNNHQNDRLRNQSKSTSNYNSTSNSTNASNTNNSSSSNNNNNDDDNKEQATPEQRPWSYVEDENIISDMFFAKQMISNSCATHALISILLNCDYNELNLGPILTRLKEHAKVMNPENRGYAIGNLPEIAKAHNSHASYSSLYNRAKLSSHSAGMSFMVSGNQRTNLQQQKHHEAYHFVSYVPIKNRLYELDGLKNFPIDHGPIGPGKDWTEKFRAVIKERLSGNKSGDDEAISSDIRYNLMAVVPDKRLYLRSQLRRLKNFEKCVDVHIDTLTERVFTPLRPLDVDVPKPPYSPLSTGTLTASETGSVCNSPNHINDDFFPENNVNKSNNYIFIKFGCGGESGDIGEDDPEPAHKNCVTNFEATTEDPLNMTKDALGKQVSKPQVSTRRSSKDVKNNGTTDEAGKQKLANSSEEPSDNPKITTDNSDDTKDQPSSPSGKKLDSLAGEEERMNDDVANDVVAHKDEKYNLSAEPPFDFNILDKMQHVHTGKETLKDLLRISTKIATEIEKIEYSLKEENEKRRNFRIDNSRRTHNYEPFIMTFLSMLAKQGNLADLIERDLGLIPEDTTNASSTPLASRTASNSANVTQSAPTNNKTSTPYGKAYKNSTPQTKLPNGTPTSTGRGSSSASKVGTNATKPRYKYVSTGRPVGRPRKNPLPTPNPQT